jgi:phosphatidate cytidylyltransferase
MATRIATASIGLPLVVLLVWVGGAWFTVLVAVVAGLGALEMSGLARGWGDRPLAPVAIVWAVAFVVAGHLLSNRSSLDVGLLSIVPIAVGLLLASVMWCHGSGTRLAALGATAAAALYTGGLLFHAPLLRGLEQGREWVLLLLLATFATDTFALVVGRIFGRRPLAPSISPSKTWEGAIGGLLGAVAMAVAAVYVLDIDAGIGDALAVGALIGVAGQAGDLVESRLKRLAGADNSGWLLPGHGGILDRLDSIVFNLVVVYYFVI